MNPLNTGTTSISSFQNSREKQYHIEKFFKVRVGHGIEKSEKDAQSWIDAELKKSNIPARQSFSGGRLDYEVINGI
ncbi:MAG: hypothetical protein C0415_04060 [Thermodesulfovibrio sp.]|nr:hypothetical protein [Thermodesulfovibrio sp.]